MKKIFLFIFPILLTGFILPENRCGHSAGTITITGAADGPYVFYQNDHIYTKYIFDNAGVMGVATDSVDLQGKDKIILNVSTDEPGKTFSVRLQKDLQKEKAEYKKADKQLALSDIEGNFGPFRKLLQSNGVIDSNYNWTFGDGHLILIGDFFDRGSQVTEVLWLIYSLEEKAKAAGGYVHFVLGNHEIMNLSGDIRYVLLKYKDNAELLARPYVYLYGENSELGRWLRTKNVVEKVGDMLYMHGGISSQVNSMNVSVENINDLVRPFYADSSNRYPNRKVETLYGDLGPFWYRGYYTGATRATPEQIDSTLTKFGVRHIATGHTIVGDTVSTWFNGKVFNTDVHHARGKSEALFIEGGKYYRVNTSGEKFLIAE